MFKKSIAFLLENANPSIKRRVKSEMLHDLAPEVAAKTAFFGAAHPISRAPG